MRAVVVTGTDAEVADDVELSAPRDGEVVVAVHRCGLCLTDVHIAQGLLDFPRPVVCGHEVAGVVDALGPGVADLRPGDRVVVACRPPCRRCPWCVGGQPQLCDRSRAWATGARADGSSPLTWRGDSVALGVGVGGFAEQVVAPASAVVPIAEDVPVELAAVMGCAVLTGAGAVLNTARAQPGSTVVVVGLGGVELAAVQAARAVSAVVIGMDPRQDRRLSAVASGATVAEDAEELAQLVGDVTHGRGADVAIDCVGDTGASIPAAFDAIRPGGHLVIAGVPPSGAQIVLPAAALVSDERRVSGCFLGSSDAARDIPLLLDLWRSGRFGLESLVTEVVGLHELPALLTSEETPPGIRTVVTMEHANG